MSSTSTVNSGVFNDQQLLEGLWADDYEVLKVIYKRYQPQVLAFVRKYGGEADEAEDVFQDALVVVLKKKDTGFTLTSALGTYLIGVSRFIWMRKREKKNREVGVTPEHIAGLTDADELERTLLHIEKRKLFREKLAMIDENCKRVLTLFFARVPLKEIAQKMNYTTDYIKKKNRTCKVKLTKLIQEDYRYGDFS